MKRIVALGLVAGLLVCVSGCGGPDALMKELVANLNLCADLIERNEPRDKILAAIERVNSTVEKINKLKLSKEEQEALVKRHEGELKRARERLDKAQKERKLAGHDDLPPIEVEKILAPK